jgi:hypothetical protein
VGPKYKPKPWKQAKQDAAALLMEWTNERETAMKRRDQEMLASVTGIVPSQPVEVSTA